MMTLIIYTKPNKINTIGPLWTFYMLHPNNKDIWAKCCGPDLGYTWHIVSGMMAQRGLYLLLYIWARSDFHAVCPAVLQQRLKWPSSTRCVWDVLCSKCREHISVTSDASSRHVTDYWFAESNVFQAIRSMWEESQGAASACSCRISSLIRVWVRLIITYVVLMIISWSPSSAPPCTSQSSSLLPVELYVICLCPCSITVWLTSWLTCCSVVCCVLLCSCNSLMCGRKKTFMPPCLRAKSRTQSYYALKKISPTNAVTTHLPYFYQGLKSSMNFDQTLRFSVCYLFYTYE